MTKIYISYRRDDSDFIAHRIRNRLLDIWGGPFEPLDVCIDVDLSWKKQPEKRNMQRAVAQCEVQLVIIGKRWAAIANSAGKRLLDDPDDLVRIELEAALSHNMPQFILLVDGADLPLESEMPLGLRKLVNYTPTHIRYNPEIKFDSLNSRRDDEFQEMMAPLIMTLQKVLEQTNLQCPVPVRSRPQAFPPLRPEAIAGRLAVSTKLDGSGRRFGLPLLEWINIPSGHVTIIDRHNTTFEVAIVPFALAKYPVTNEQFQAFVTDGGYLDDQWWEGLGQRFDEPKIPSWSDATLPRESVSWYEAIAFCRWLTVKLSLPVTLPTEMQWQWAALGDDGRECPWGNFFDASICNTAESSLHKTTPVDTYPKGQSPYGAFDMVGNVSEWCLNEYQDILQVSTLGRRHRALRGCSWAAYNNWGWETRHRGVEDPALQTRTVGFRVAVVAS